ncbi:MAG: hypothetical protein DRG78_17295 [Epsilonproteobacteria bacterium]|nr:MAG: hypothetical protein DRG78_17295 [Campylobacterota bacterium]
MKYFYKISPAGNLIKGSGNSVLLGYIEYKIGEEPKEFLVIENTENTKKNLAKTKLSLMTICDNKQDEAEKLILGYKATPKQLQRYKDKFDRATEGEFDEATNKLIISKHNEFLTALRKFVDLIELFRSNVDDIIIAGDLEKANKLIELAEAFDTETTIEDINSLFKGVE